MGPETTFVGLGWPGDQWFPSSPTIPVGSTVFSGRKWDRDTQSTATTFFGDGEDVEDPELPPSYLSDGDGHHNGQCLPCNEALQ